MFQEPAIAGLIASDDSQSVLEGLGIEQTVLTDCDKGCIR